MSNTEAEPRSPSRGSHHICVPFASEAHYEDCMADVNKYRTYLTEVAQHHPELFPQALAQGYWFHDRYPVRKQQCVVRRIKLKATGAVFTLRPSFLLPYGIGRTEEVEKALFLRQWGVPFAALAYVFGRNAMFWYRAWLSLGRPNLVGTTVKKAATMPQDLVADEKITWMAGDEVVVPTTVGGGCVLGISVATQATSAELQKTYGEFKAEATAIFPDYAPRSVCTDGFAATRDAWHELFPQLTVVLCFLHAILKLTDRCRGTLRRQVLDRAWAVYHAVTKAQFAQRLRRLAEWARRGAIKSEGSGLTRGQERSAAQESLLPVEKSVAGEQGGTAHGQPRTEFRRAPECPAPVERTGGRLIGDRRGCQRGYGASR